MTAHTVPIVRLSRKQVREIDRLALERYHIPGIVLMENAARAAANVAVEMLSGKRAAGDGNGNGDTAAGAGAVSVAASSGAHDSSEPHESSDAHARVLILCGGGNNGGDGLAVARHLHNGGADVSIALTLDPGKYTGDARTNFDIVRAMELPIISFNPASPDAINSVAARSDLVIDAIFGTGLDQPPRPPFAQIAAIVSSWNKPVLAIDLPSGLDCDTGKPLGACIRAAQTITFVAEKIGFGEPGAAAYTGAVTVGDIGCPRELIDAVRA